MYAYELFAQNSHSNCGLEFFGFDRYEQSTRWSMAALVSLLPKKPMFRHVVAFSGNKMQANHNLGPHTFAAWLKKQGETVTASRWQNHNTGQIKCYFWYPSLKFKKAFNKAWLSKKRGPVTPTYY